MKGLPKSVKKVPDQPGSKNDKSEDHGADASSMMGPVFDKFVRNSSAKQYVSDRRAVGAGV